MLKLSEKAIELLRTKLDLNSKEQDIVKNQFFEKIEEDVKQEKVILNDILSNFIAINQSFDNVIKLLVGNAPMLVPQYQEKQAVSIGASFAGKREKGKSGLLELLGFGLFAFSPAIIDYLKEVASDPEKIKESLSKAFNWLTTDLPNFFKNDLGPFLSNFLDKEIIGSITGMDLLKSAGIATVLYAGKGVIISALSKALLNSVGWFLKSFIGFLVSPAALAVMAGAGIGLLVYQAFKSWEENGAAGSDKAQQERIDGENQRVETFIKSLNDSGVLARGNIKPQTVRDAFLTKDKSSGKYIGLNIQPGQLKILESKVKEIGSKPPSGDDKEKQGKITEVLTLLNRSGAQSDAPIGPDGKAAQSLGIDARTGEMVYDDGLTVADRARKDRKADAAAKGKSAPPGTDIISARVQQPVAAPATPVGTTEAPMATAQPTTSAEGESSATQEAVAVPTIGEESQQTAPPEAAAEQAPPTFDSLVNNFSSMMGGTATEPSAQQKSVETAQPLFENIMNKYLTASGVEIGQASAEAAMPKKQKPIIVPPAQPRSNEKTLIKPGESWNINDVPDPTPKLGSLISQLFVPETNFSGAISI